MSRMSSSVRRVRLCPDLSLSTSEIVMKKKQLHLWSTSLVVIAIVAASCSKGSPTSPSGGAELPNATGSVKVSINPNPVPFSGVPVTDTPGCATLPNTWFYDQVFTETAGNAVTLTSRTDFFDGSPSTSSTVFRLTFLQRARPCSKPAGAVAIRRTTRRSRHSAASIPVETLSSSTRL